MSSRSVYMKKFRASLKLRGLCQECFKEVEKKGSPRCKACKRKRADYQQRVRDAIKAEAIYDRTT